MAFLNCSVFQLFLSYFVFILAVNGYPRGAPYSSCISQYPQHGSQPQTDPSPFSLVISQTTYAVGDQISVTIAGPEFIGFVLTARRIEGNTEELVGSFTIENESHGQVYNCLGGDRNFVTHRDDDLQKNTTVKWSVVAKTVGNIVFKATVLETESKFWTELLSPNVIDSTSSTDIGVLPQVESLTIDMDLERDCGKTKGCFLTPNSCKGTECNMAVTYQMDEHVIHFELMGPGDGYVGVAFSQDKTMGDDNVIACTADAENVRVQHGYNVGYKYLKQYSDKLTNLATSKKDGKIYCRFTTPISLVSVSVEEDYDAASTPKEVFMDLSNGTFVFLAFGKIYEDGDELAEHVETPVQSVDVVDFRQFTLQKGASLSKFTQVHGILMILAWMFFVSLATVGARYFRHGFGSRMCNGLLLWFQIHRAATMTTGCLTAAGFILIFIKVKGLSKKARYHSYIGIAVMAATCCQIFLGLIRPNATSSKRPVFNWAHRLLGKSAHILAATDLVLAFRLPQLNSSMRHTGFIIVLVWISVQIVWEIALEINRYFETESSKEKNFDPDSSQMQLEKAVKTKPNGRLLSWFFAFHTLTILSCTGAAIYVLVLF